MRETNSLLFSQKAKKPLSCLPSPLLFLCGHLRRQRPQSLPANSPGLITGVPACSAWSVPGQCLVRPGLTPQKRPDPGTACLAPAPPAQISHFRRGKRPLQACIAPFLFLSFSAPGPQLKSRVLVASMIPCANRSPTRGISVGRASRTVRTTGRGSDQALPPPFLSVPVWGLLSLASRLRGAPRRTWNEPKKLGPPISRLSFAGKRCRTHWKQGLRGAGAGLLNLRLELGPSGISRQLGVPLPNCHPGLTRVESAKRSNKSSGLNLASVHPARRCGAHELPQSREESFGVRGKAKQVPRNAPQAEFTLSIFHFPHLPEVVAHARQTGPLRANLICWLEVTRHRTTVSMGRSRSDNCPNRAAAE